MFGPQAASRNSVAMDHLSISHVVTPDVKNNTLDGNNEVVENRLSSLMYSLKFRLDFN